jgi:hypothetical protein
MPNPTDEFEKLDEQIEELLKDLDEKTKEKLKNGELELSDIDF